MRIAYIDCVSGISGDMFLGALIDAGVPLEKFQETIAALNRAGDLDVRFETERTNRSGISATKANVLTVGEQDEPRVEHHHYHEHRHGHTHEHAHENVLGHKHVAVAEEAESEEHGHNHSHAHRGLREIRAIISRTEISTAAKTRALDIFEKLGAAEAKIHDIPVEHVHFHEVGAADAIVDIACAAVGSEELGVDEWICSPLNVGSGSIECAHGRFPVPAPATAELLKNAPVYSSGIEAELVTPTGAAIVASLARRFAPLPQLKIEKIGYGAGTRDFAGHANVLRLLMGESNAPKSESVPGAELETLSVLECSVDDSSPQVLAYAVELALNQGALDAFASPLAMKKGRNGVLLTVLSRTEDSARIAAILFRETTTLGIRTREEQRWVLPRKQVPVDTRWGRVRMKVAGENATPEYEDCRRIAEQQKIPLRQVMGEAIKVYEQQVTARTR